MLRARLTLAFVVAGLAGRAAAHDLLIDRRPDGFVLRIGERAGGEGQPLALAKVTAIRCASSGATQDLRRRASASAREVRLPGPCEVVSAAIENGFFVLTPDGEKNLPRTRVKDAVKSWRLRQWAKWVDARARSAATPIGEGLEIVPATDLGRARVGGKVTLRVLLDGKPVRGAILSIDDDPVAETPADGEARVKVRHTLEAVSATIKLPLDAPEADMDVLEASLTFEAAP